MKLDAKTFKVLLVHAKRVVEIKSHMPALRCVRIEGAGGTARIDATNLAAWLSLTAPAEGELPAVLVDLCQLTLVLDGVKAKKTTTPIALSVEWKPGPAPTTCRTPHPERTDLRCDEHYGHEGKHSAWVVGQRRVEWDPPATELPNPPDEPVLHIEAGARRFTLAAMRADVFPKAPVVGPERQRRAYKDAEHLHGTFVYAAPAMSGDDTRRHLVGVWLQRDGLFAVDGHRLHFTRGLPAVEGEVFVPAKAVRVLVGLLGKAGSACELRVYERCDARAAAAMTKRQCGARSGRHVCELKPRHRGSHQDLAPPPIEHVLPDPDYARVRIETERAALAEAFALAGKVAIRGATRFSVNGAVRVSAKGEHVGGVMEELSAKFEGAVEMGLSAEYVVEALRGLGERVLVSNAGEPLAPLRIETADGDDGRLAVVMPMRLADHGFTEERRTPGEVGR